MGASHPAGPRPGSAPATPPAALPLALRTAPAPARPADGRDQLLGALVAPVRSGVLLTSADLRAAAEVAGLGYRMGERRYTLQAMLDQDASATLGWLGNHARQQATLHAAEQPIGGQDPRHWWGTARPPHRPHPAAAANVAGHSRLSLTSEYPPWYCRVSTYRPGGPQMCSPAVCDRCKKITWTGCGQHVEEALAGVPPEKRCTCR